MSRTLLFMIIPFYLQSVRQNADSLEDEIQAVSKSYWQVVAKF